MANQFDTIKSNRKGDTGNDNDYSDKQMERTMQSIFDSWCKYENKEAAIDAVLNLQRLPRWKSNKGKTIISQFVHNKAIDHENNNT